MGRTGSGGDASGMLVPQLTRALSCPTLCQRRGMGAIHKCSQDPMFRGLTRSSRRSSYATPSSQRIVPTHATPYVCSRTLGGGGGGGAVGALLKGW